MCLLDLDMCEKCRSSHSDCISFTFSCFLFPVRAGSKKFDDWWGKGRGGGGVKDFRTGGYQFGGEGIFAGGVSIPLHAMEVLIL